MIKEKMREMNKRCGDWELGIDVRTLWGGERYAEKGGI